MRTDLLVIGAGIAGLAAARRVRESAPGTGVVLVDKGRQVGGRMALRRFRELRYDTGAQFFTARDDRFRRAVEEARADGIVTEWFGKDDIAWRGVHGMTDLPKWIAADLKNTCEVILSERVVNLRPADDSVYPFRAEFDSGREAIEARSVIATPPVPQTIDLTAPEFLAEFPRSLCEITYHPCLVLLVEVAPDDTIHLPDGELARFPKLGIDVIADNTGKGLNADTHTLTVHFSPVMSRDLYDSEESVAIDELLAILSVALGDASLPVRALEGGRVQLKRWRYARPVSTHTERTVRSEDPAAPLYVAGDAFGGPRVEGAFLSGTAAAERVLAELGGNGVS